MSDLKIKIPKNIINEAEKKGINVDLIKDMTRSFILMEIVAQMSKLSEKDAHSLSKKIKESAWKKIQKK